MISIVLPAYNEAKVIGSVINDISRVMNDYGQDYDITVVDDGSQDNTGDIAGKAGATVHRHPYNIGNGAAVKTGLRSVKGDIIVLLDSDGQHDPKLIPTLLENIPKYDMAIGARIKNKSGAFHRNIANNIFNWFSSYLTNFKILDLTSGFRVIKRSVILKYIYLLPNTFSYPTTSTMALIRGGHSVTYVPIEVHKRVGKSKIKIFKDGTRFLLIMLKIATFFSPFRVFFPISIISVLLGFIHGIYKILILDQRYTYLTVFLISTGVLVFLMGLISEQIAQLRFDRSENTEVS